MKRAVQIVMLIAAAALPRLGAAQAVDPAPLSFDLERLELNPSGNGSAVVGSAELLPAGTFRSAVLAHYANEPLLLVADDQVRGRIIRERLTLHLMRQYSVAQRVELAILLPIVVFQSGDDLTGAGLHRLAPGGLSSPVLSARIGLLRSADGSPIDLAVQFASALPFGNAYAFARNPGFSLAPRMMASMKVLDQWMINAEGGASLRPPVTLGDLTIHNELNANIGIATLNQGLRGELALRGGYYFNKAPNSLEVLAGARYGLTDRIDLTTVVSYGALRTPGTPLFRILFGASFLESSKASGTQPSTPAPTPVLISQASKPPDSVTKTDQARKPGEFESQKPGGNTVLTVANQASNKPVCTPGQSHDPKACPELDLDNDGLKNSADTCPAAAEDKDGFQDADGCPDPDNDADTVADAQDKCPTEAGPVDREGCPLPDEDKDGVEDSQDGCPKIAGPADRKGCPLSDTDGDGILDSADGCPSDKGPLEARGCPVKDTDGDKIPDHLDNCPNEAGTAKNRGCAAAEKQLVYITREKLVITDTVHFATNSARVLPKSFLLLKQVARVIKDHPEIRKVIVEGHTDNVGNALKNLRLSQQRADSIRRYLVLQGISPSRLEAKGYGHTRPIMPNLMPRGRAANRRVEFTIPEAE